MSVAQSSPDQMDRTLGAFFHLLPQESCGSPPTFSGACRVYSFPYYCRRPGQQQHSTMVARDGVLWDVSSGQAAVQPGQNSYFSSVQANQTP